ncbi:methyltransferase [Fusarium bulbicola]|nr:methyltransferase [Fusarium bulbicola]
MDYRTFDSAVRGQMSWSVTHTTIYLSNLFTLEHSSTKMSSPAHKKATDSSSVSSSPPLVGLAESGLLPLEHWSQLIIHERAYQSERVNPEYWGPIDDTGQEAMGVKEVEAPVPGNIQADMKQREFADKFPNASVIGTDLAPIQPGWIPPNLGFQIEDCTGEWIFQPNTFDYIHMRWLVYSIADWKSLFKEAYKCLKPGGYIESYEPPSRVESDDGTVQSGIALSQWKKFFVEGGHRIGQPFTIFEETIQREGMKEAGFSDIEERDYKNPVGGWPKGPKQRSVGQYMQAAFEQDTQGTMLHMATALG